LFDDKWDIFYYARAEAFRAISSEELQALSMHISPEQKRIEVDLDRQWATCYEDDRAVFVAKISSGLRLDTGGYWTPEGVFSTFYKRPSRHMVAGNRASGYDLPGVPWVSYITDYGISFHGTYWHNAFGAPRSHGCINMTSDAARFIYRWTTPVVPHDQTWVRVESGTRVQVFQKNSPDPGLPRNDR
jgi:lipoprotein-anchoring transpeptidase ErfK/SrfK